jgi:alcohol dehydrogenase (cytochrome c)
MALVTPLGAADLIAVANASEAPEIKSAPAFDHRELLALPTAGWLTNGGNLYNQRFSPLRDINRTNVNQLRANWRVHLNGSGLEAKYSGEAQPIVHEGVIYIATGANDVFAISVKTGAILWQYQADLDPDISTLCCGWISRGVALGDGKVFIGRLDGRLVALNQQTGETVWSVQAERWQDGFSITSAPLYYDNMVITGFAGAEYGIRGRVKAYDAHDGTLLWTFYTIPGPGEPGHDTWPQDNEVWKHGGSSVWQTPAVDPELGLLYFSTGNPGPDFNGAVRAGDNLYSDSIIAVDAATGEYRWHFQQVHHDIWDYDSSNPVILFNVTIAGRQHKAIAEVSKTGWVYILDRITGKPLLGIEEKPVPQEPGQATAATQPHPVGEPVVPHEVPIAPEGHQLVNQGRIFTPFLGDEGAIISPSLFGGANWPPSSYDPNKQLLYVCASDVLGNFIGGDRDFALPGPGQVYHGGVVGFANSHRYGIFAAMDMTTNKIAWRYRWNDQCYSGSVATAGDLVFVGRSDGRFMALDSDTGMTLWEFQTDAGVNSTASIFEYEGNQYVVVLSAGNLLAGSVHGDSVWLFSLQGTLTSLNREAMSEQSNFELNITAADADTVNGAKTFREICVPCHGTDGRGGHGGGAPLDKVDDFDLFVHKVANGVNDMPSFGATLTAEQIRDVSAYVIEELLP